MNNSPSDEHENSDSRRDEGAIEPESSWEPPGYVSPSGEPPQSSDSNQPGYPIPPGQYPHGNLPPGNYPPGQPYPGQYPPGQFSPGQYPPGAHAPGPYPPPGYPHVGHLGYSPDPGYVPQRSSEGIPFWAQVGIGAAIGSLIAALLVVTLFTSAGRGPAPTLVLSLVAVIAGIIFLFIPKVRGYGTGALIMIFAAWLVVIGPCLALFYG